MSVDKTFLVSHWKLDETSGSRADAHTGGNTLTDNGISGTTGVAAKVGNGANFDAAFTQYFSRTSNTSLQSGTGDFGFAFWFIVDQQTNHVLIGKDVDSPASSRDYTIDIAITNLRFYINGGGTVLLQHSLTIDTGVWYFVCAWHDAIADTLNIQINNGTPETVATGGETPTQSSAEFRIGGRAYSGAEGYFDGIVDEVSWFKGAFPGSSERNQLYNGGNGITFEDWDATAGGTIVPVFMNQYRQRVA